MAVRQLINGFFLSLAVLFFTASAVYANCTGPAGTEGQIIYNIDHHVPQFCDGMVWRGMSGGGGGGASGCVGPADCPSPTGDNLCDDGTIFIGCAQPMNTEPLFVERCDAGAIPAPPTLPTSRWDGAACTGSAALTCWASSTNATTACAAPVTYVTTNATSWHDGEGNTNTLAPLDADSGTVGTQYHRAAKYCAELVAHGHDDWYLPSYLELERMYVYKTEINNAAATTTDDFPASSFWSSSEYLVNNAWYQSFSNGLQNNNLLKNNNVYVRCVRR